MPLDASRRALGLPELSEAVEMRRRRINSMHLAGSSGGMLSLVYVGVNILTEPYCDSWRDCENDVAYQKAIHAFLLRFYGALGGLLPVAALGAYYGGAHLYARSMRKRAPKVLHASFQTHVQATNAVRLKTATDLAARERDVSTLERLLRTYPTFPWHDPVEGSVLQQAINEAWPTEAFAALIEMGEKPTTHELELAVQLRREPAVLNTLLAANHARVQWQSLASAIAQGGDPAVLTQLLEALPRAQHAAVVNQRFDNGDTLLCAAAQRPRAPALLSALLNAGADVNQRCEGLGTYGVALGCD